MQHMKRRAFWFCTGVAFTLGALHIIPEQTPLESGKSVEISEDAPTVWDIAKREFPSEDPRRITYQIEKLNPGIEYDRVKTGQEIILPAGE